MAGNANARPDEAVNYATRGPPGNHQAMQMQDLMK